MQFPLVDTGYAYRPLKLAKPYQTGWDCFALQTALGGVTADGFFGPLTDAAVRKAQATYALIEDGIAGVLTQRSLAEAIIARTAGETGLGPRLYGQVEKESSFWLGNYTPPYQNNSRDCGVVQRNTQYTAMFQGFNAKLSIEALSEKILTYHSKYRKEGVEDPRAWNLAQAAWNCPAWTDKLALGKYITAAQLDHVDAYIQAVTAYAQ